MLSSDSSSQVYAMLWYLLSYIPGPVRTADMLTLHFANKLVNLK